MTDFCIGDQVVCRIFENAIISSMALEWEEELIFEIIKVDPGNRYTIYIPSDIVIKDAIFLTASNLHYYELNKKFLDSYIYHILDLHILRMYRQQEGYLCARCSYEFPHAEINRLDENGHGIFVCFLCRTYPYR